jgi:hypothetical protein
MDPELPRIVLLRQSGISGVCPVGMPLSYAFGAPERNSPGNSLLSMPLFAYRRAARASPCDSRVTVTAYITATATGPVRTDDCEKGAKS